MKQIIDCSDPNEISAFLTTSIITHSYEVESTQAVVSLWDDIRNNVVPKEDGEYISAVLTAGRIMDYKFDIDGPKILNNLIKDIGGAIKSRNIALEDLQKDLICAYVASATISRSARVETVREIVDLWEQIKDGLEITDDLDIIAAILSTGRLMELKISVDGFPIIRDIFSGIKNELAHQAEGREVTKGDLAAAFITAAYVEISPKVEKMRDMVNTWMVISGQTVVVNTWDYIASILTTGRIKDMDAFHIQSREELSSISEKIRAQIREVIGE